MREVGQTGGPVDQGQPDRGEREEQPESQPVERALDEEVGPAGGRVERPGADLEQGHEGLLLHIRAELDVDGALGLAPGGDVLGQRILVKGHLVLAGLFRLVAPLPGVVGGHRRLPARGRGDDDVDVGDGVLLRPERAHDAGRGVGGDAQLRGLGSLGRGGDQHHHQWCQQRRQQADCRVCRETFADRGSGLHSDPPFAHPAGCNGQSRAPECVPAHTTRHGFRTVIQLLRPDRARRLRRRPVASRAAGPSRSSGSTGTHRARRCRAPSGGRPWRGRPPCGSPAAR